MIKKLLFMLAVLVLGLPAFAQDSAAIQAQMDRVQTELQELRGALETQNVSANQAEQKSDRNYRDLEMRLQAIEGKIKLFQDTLDQLLSKLSPAAAQEYKKFQNALNLIDGKDYTKALAAFQQFIKQYPKSSRRAEALFWVAECRYATNDYSQAIKDYQKFVEVNPKSDKAPEAIYKQGEGFLRLNMKNEAKVFFKKVIQDYPSSEQSTQAKVKLDAIEKEGTAAPVAPAPAPTPAAPVITAPTTPPLAPTPPAPEKSEF